MTHGLILPPCCLPLKHFVSGKLTEAVILKHCLLLCTVAPTGSLQVGSCPPRVAQRATVGDANWAPEGINSDGGTSHGKVTMRDCVARELGKGMSRKPIREAACVSSDLAAVNPTLGAWTCCVFLLIATMQSMCFFLTFLR